jgi:hypothetical protein
VIFLTLRGVQGTAPSAHHQKELTEGAFASTLLHIMLFFVQLILFQACSKFLQAPPYASPNLARIE